MLQIIWPQIIPMSNPAFEEAALVAIPGQDNYFEVQIRLF